MKAFLKNYRQSPRKVRLVANLVKGKSVSDAVVALEFLPKRASTPLRKLLLSALANAKSQGQNEEMLFIQEMTVDKGIVMKRMMPRAMGRGARINKRTSHVAVTLAERTTKAKKSHAKAGQATAKKAAETEAKETKKEVKKTKSKTTKKTKTTKSK